MTNTQKQHIKNALVRYLLATPDADTALFRLRGISRKVIADIKNNNWEEVDDASWHAVARRAGYSAMQERPGDTGAYLMLRLLFSDAQNHAGRYVGIAGHGLGKSYAAAAYMQEHCNVCCITGDGGFHRRSFLTALLRMEGMEASGSLEEMTKRWVAGFTAKDAPLLIIDDAHRLTDAVLHTAATLAALLDGKAGVVLMGSMLLKLRIQNGYRTGTDGYADIYPVFGKRFAVLNGVNPADVAPVCEANGISDPDLVRFITEKSNGNLHVASRLIREFSFRPGGRAA